jgi:hypothetical protein
MAPTNIPNTEPKPPILTPQNDNQRAEFVAAARPETWPVLNKQDAHNPGYSPLKI